MYGGVSVYKLLKSNLNFRYFYLGAIISCIGDYLYDIAVTLLVYNITKSVNSIAFMWISKGALRIFVQYIAGIITDRYNRKKIMIFTNVASIPIALMFMSYDYVGIWIIYLCAFLLQALNDIDVCSEMAILPEIVDNEHLTDANTIFSLTETIVTFISLALSSVIYKKFGANILFIINAISFFGASIFFRLIKYTSAHKVEENLKLVIFDKEVFKIINKKAIVKYTILISGALAIIGRLYDVYNIAIADTILGVGAEGIIFFRYAMVIGGLLTPIIIKRIKFQNELKKYLVVSELAICSFIILPFSNSIILAMIDLVVFALMLSMQGIFFRNILQENVNNGYIGRVFSMYKILITVISLLTVSIVPLIEGKLSVQLIFTICGSIILAISLFCSCITKCKKNINIGEF